MRFLGWSALFAGWLVVSAFVLPQTAASAAVAVGVAFVTLSLSAFAVGRPGVRYLNAVLALLLAGVALLGDLPAIAAASDALVAAALFALSLVSPRHHVDAPAVAAGR